MLPKSPFSLPVRIRAVQELVARATRDGNITDRIFWLSKLAALREELSSQ